MIRLVIDAKETNSGIIAELKKREDLEIEVKSLDIGDYIVGDGHGIERKEATDFVNSLITDKRLFLQAQNMVECYEKATILVEGSIFDTRSAITSNALCGALSHLRNTIGISIVPTKNARISAEYIYWSAKHLQVGIADVPLRSTTPKNATLGAIFIAEGLPGVGPTMARKLLQHFGSVHGVVTASKEDLKCVPGLGPKTIDKILAQLHHRV